MFTLLDYVEGRPIDECCCIVLKRTYKDRYIMAKGGIIDFIARGHLESILKDDCFQIRCDVCMANEFPAVPAPDLHRPLTLTQRDINYCISLSQVLPP